MVKTKMHVDKNEKNKTDFIFMLGVFLIPFDNLIFAPSSGWATVSPLLFFLYLILNFKKIRLEISPIILLFFMFAIISSFINYLVYQPNISAFIDGISTLLLGISSYYAFKIYFNHNKSNSFILLLIIAYSISYIYGLLYLADIQIVNLIMGAIEKRHYDRLAYTFTEPSFISLHVYGIILPIIYIFKSNKNIKYLKFLCLLFVVTTFLFGSSTRFLIDSIFVLFFLIFFKIINDKKKTLIFIALLLLTVIILYKYSDYFMGDRISRIRELGVYADASLASRWFRINSSIHGYFESPINLFFGFGFSNSDYPFKLGYDIAFSEYANPYTEEVLSLKEMFNSQLFCMPIRLISEFGLVGVTLLIIWLIRYIKKGNILIFAIILYLYLQFDSYAFYSIWIYLFYVNYLGERKKEKVSCDYSYEYSLLI